MCVFENMGKDPGDRLRTIMPRDYRVEYPGTALTDYSESGLMGGFGRRGSVVSIGEVSALKDRVDDRSCLTLLVQPLDAVWAASRPWPEWIVLRLSAVPVGARG